MSSTGSDFRDALLLLIPTLRAFARSLCRDRDRADDLVQTALLAAWEKRDTIRDPTRLRAWLLQILRNEHLMSIRRRARDLASSSDAILDPIASEPSQGHRQGVGDVQTALAQLSSTEREAIMLVAVQELTYEQAAVICACPAGTMKSRVCRARAHLRKIMSEPAALGEIEAPEARPRGAV